MGIDAVQTKCSKEKARLFRGFKAGYSSQKEPIAISNVATKDWGVFEYWNIGMVTEELINFGIHQDWLWPKDPKRFMGRKYKPASPFGRQKTRTLRAHCLVEKTSIHELGDGTVRP